ETESIDVMEAKGVATNTQIKRIPTLENIDNLYKGIVVLQLKRSIFIKERSIRQKRIEKVQAPLHLAIKKEQTSGKDKDRNYDLAGFIWHTGGVDSGHYVAYINKGNIWVCYNDNQVRVISDAEAGARAQEASLFFYQPSQIRRTT
ncbi:hypothetical protein GR268_46065, partial [Rhizobium leguminosarum]|nr:hypothetical protein [Rhizobium leguminosarum]